MARTKDLIVVEGSTVYRITKTNWKRYLEARSAGTNTLLTDTGAKALATVDRDVTVFSAVEASGELTAMNTAEVAESVAA